MREQLKMLIENLDVYDCEECQRCPSYKYDLKCDDNCFSGKVADYLISNGVVPVVRCKDCKYYTTEDFDGDILCGCKLYCAMLDITPDDFCSYGERKDT